MNLELSTLIQVITALGAVIWTVSQIRSTTLALRVEISALGRSLDALRDAVAAISSLQMEHEGRLSRMEGFRR